MGCLFSKQIDKLSEESIERKQESFEVNSELNIGCLEWIDDVATTTTGLKNQRNVLKIADASINNSQPH